MTPRGSLHVMQVYYFYLFAWTKNHDHEHFTHFPYYDPAYGTMKSFLVSRCEQAIHIGGLNNSFHFAAWEAIHTEISQKYDEEMINKLVALSGLRVVETYFDKANYFCDVLTRAR